MNLGNSLKSRICGNRQENMENAISCYRCALEVYTRESFPENWADTQMNLGMTLCDRMSGNQMKNVEDAISCYKCALEVYTRESFPKKWALAQMSLGNALRNRIFWNRMMDMEDTMSCYKFGLGVCSRIWSPGNRADTQMNLGNALQRRISRGRISRGRTVDLEDAISCYRCALEVYTRESFPEEWADTQMNLGNALRNRISGNRMMDIEDALSYYRYALEVYTRESFPEQWAETQIRLGMTLCDRISGNRIENMEDAMSCYRYALEVYTRESFPEKWADTQIELGIALCDRISGNRIENMETAISCYKRALEVYTRESFPKKWAITQTNLGIALKNRVSGNQMKNIEDAITCYRCALEVCTRESFTEQWACTQMNLGNALQNRVFGNRIENMEDAISCFKCSLEVYTRELFPEDWAGTQVNLGNALQDRVSGDRIENMEGAISYYRCALEIFTRESFPEKWADTQMNLGNALRDRISGNRIVDMEDAISCYKCALEVCTRESFPEKWARIQMNLGIVLKNRISGNRVQNIKDSITCLEKVLELWTKESSPYYWSCLCSNIAQAYIERSCFSESITDGEDFAFLRQGLKFACMSMSVLVPGNDPLMFARFSIQKVLALSGLGRNMESAHAAQYALDVLKPVYSLASTGILYNRRLMDTHAGLASAMVGGYIRLRELKMALEACENAKAGLLQSWISNRIAVELHCSAEERDEFEKIGNKLRNLQIGLDKTLVENKTAYEILLHMFQEENCALNSLLSSVRKRSPESSAHKCAGRILSATELLKYLCDKKGVLAMEFFFSNDVANSKDGRFEKALNVFCLWNGNIYVREFANLPNPSGKIYQNAFLGSQFGKMYSNTANKREEKERSLRDLEKSYLAQVGSILETTFEEACHSQIPDKLLIVPHLGLHKIPFGAVPLSSLFVEAQTAAQEKSSTGLEPKAMLCDAFKNGITYAPTLSIAACLEKARVRRGSIRNAQIVSFTCPSLGLSEFFEGLVVNAWKGDARNVLPFEGQEATPSNVRGYKEVRECDILHFNCHGRFSGRSGLLGQLHAYVDISSVVTSSGLYLGRNNGKRMLLSISDIWSLRLQHCRLVCVVACSGGVVRYSSQSDECLSIGTAFLVAGARNVVCSLWPVYQAVALVIISKFYRIIYGAIDRDWDSVSLAACLSKAQRWYRDLSKEEHIQAFEDLDLDWHEEIDNKDYYNWAAFTILGPSC